MDSVLSTVGTIVVECGKCLCAPVWMKIKNFYKFNSNVDNLENQMGRLLDSKKLIQDQTVSDEVDGKIRTPQVIMWLQKIEEMEESVASTRAEITDNKEKLHGCRTNPSLRYKLSKQVVEKLNQVKQILDDGLPPPPLVMVDLKLKAVEFNSNVDNLENQMGRLLDSKRRIQDQLNLEEVDGKIRTPQVIMWLERIEEIETSVASTQREITDNKEKLHGCRTNPSLRYKLSKQVVEKLNQVRQMLSEGLPPQPLVMVDLRLKAVEERPGPSITSQNTAAKNLQNIMDQLEKDTVRVIGVFGMGGVGKTALITNLNNKLSEDDAQAFGLILWVTVSKDGDVNQVQRRLAERLKLEISNAETTDGIAARISARLMREPKFLLILDDVWEHIDLDKVRIPRPEVHGGYKVLLTTRFRNVCDEMAADAKLQVLPLSEDEAWPLFAQTAGDMVNSADVKPLAVAVAKECAGLPLAILVVGGAMKRKTNIESWKDALRALEKSNPVPNIQGVEKEVYLPLKLSYDSLHRKNIKECFLYCCLYPEDYSITIEDLLLCWRAEGYLDESEDVEDAYGSGRMMIERFKDSCLLENGEYGKNTVKMHDVVRDFGIWMASNSEDGCSKSLVRSGLGLEEITGVEKWGSYRRISYMRNKIEMLPDCANSQFSQVSTLLLHKNPIKNIPAGFFQGFQALRVLDVSETGIRALPGIEHLGELRALFLRSCRNMKEFPSLRGLDRLQVLDLAWTRISSMNEEGTVRRELRQCQHLVELYVCFSEGVLPNFNSEEDTILFKRLRRSSISINTINIQDKRLGLIIGSLTTLTESILFLVRQADSIFFYETAMLVIWRCLKVGVLDRLQSLTVFNPDMTEDMSQDGQVLLPSLESVRLIVVPMRVINGLFCLCGVNLRSIFVNRCNGMTKLIYFSLLHKLQSLESITLSQCDNVVEIIEDEEDNCTTPRNGNGNALPNLRRIELYELPKLKSICKQVMLWPHIRKIVVEECPALKNLPLSCQHANTIEYIKGKQEWWDELQWAEDATKSSLSQKFKILSS